MERYKIPYFSIDHLKMGLIRSGLTSLNTKSDAELTPYLWNIVKEIIKTAIENRQNLIIERCYFPFDWQKYFEKEYLDQIKFYCLIMTENYIETHFSDILNYENVVEWRLVAGDVSKKALIEENELNAKLCKKYNLNYILIDSSYEVEVELL